MFLLDTNVWIRLKNRSSQNLVHRALSYTPELLFISAISKAELVFGAYNSERVAENLNELEDFLAPFSIVPFDNLSVTEYGRARAHLRRMGTPVGPNDMLIAATAISHNLTLITANTSEFARIPGLRLENWEV